MHGNPPVARAFLPTMDSKRVKKRIVELAVVFPVKVPEDLLRGGGLAFVGRCQPVRRVRPVVNEIHNGLVQGRAQLLI